jgi:hypothetical protein
VLARVLGDDARLARQRSHLVGLRVSQLAELRDIAVRETLDVDASASRRYYAGRLIAEIDGVDRQRTLVSRQIAFCRRALAEAEQKVQAFEKLKERRRASYRYEQERRSAHELEETWQAIHAVEAPR